MNCPSCGTENPDNAVYCKRCGKRMDGCVKCPVCGALIPADSDFCSACGAKIVSDSTPPPG